MKIAECLLSAFRKQNYKQSNFQGAGELSPTFWSELQQAVVYFLTELSVKAVAEIQLKRYRFSLEQKASSNFITRLIPTN